MYSLVNISEKDVVTVQSGKKLGRVDDIRFDPITARIHSFVVFGKLKFFGLFGREADMYINYEDIVKIGTDVILVRWEASKDKKDFEDDDNDIDDVKIKHITIDDKRSRYI